MRYAPLVLLLGLLLAACAAPRVLSPDEYRARIPALEAEAGLHPDDAEVLGDLGEAYAQTGAFDQAHDVLLKARRLRSDDPKTIYYLGLAKEGLGRPEEAIALYANFEAVPRTSPYRRLLVGRHGWLSRELLRAEFADLLAVEDSIITGRAYGGGLPSEEAAGVVAVLPFAYRGEDPRNAPLARGLSEMLTVDLASVDRLRVVERLRIQALFDELQTSQARVFDRSTAPRLGRFLRSDRVVGGDVDVRSGNIQTGVALWEWGQEGDPDPAVRSADLDDLFRLEKEMAFALIDQLGVELTPGERDRIEQIPTRDLQAFLAYSRGLEEEDAGNFEAAAALFSEAVRLDPGFEAAAEKAEVMEGLAAASGGLEVGLRAGRVARADLGAAVELIGGRLTLLNQSLGGAVVPGEDSREPGAETTVTVEPAVVEPIPDPPPPPGGN